MDKDRPTWANPMYIMGNFDQMALVDGDGNSILKQIIAGGQTTDWADLATRNGTQLKPLRGHKRSV